MVATNEPLTLQQLQQIYRNKKVDIVSRLDEFRAIWRQEDELPIFKELIFCLLTPQSKAQTCWTCVKENLNNRLLTITESELAEKLKPVRFRFNKAGYITEARDKFVTNGKVRIIPKLKQFNSPFKLRGWLVDEIKGLGYKEASHFLRNIGLGEELAILDRHILRNLVYLKVIPEIPQYLRRTDYLDIEDKMRQFATESNIPLAHLDLLLWYKETGYIFK